MPSSETTAIHTQTFQTCNVQVHLYLIVICIEDEMELMVAVCYERMPGSLDFALAVTGLLSILIILVTVTHLRERATLIRVAYSKSSPLSIVGIQSHKCVLCSIITQSKYLNHAFPNQDYNTPVKILRGHSSGFSKGFWWLIELQLSI